MNIQELIQHCLDQDIQLSVQGEELKVDAAKGTLTQEIVTLLRQHKQDLVSWLKAKTSGRATPWMFKIEPVGKTDRLPLSFSQRRLWFVDRLEGGSSHYNLVGGFRLCGRLDRAALEKTVETILDRHAVLRTVFYEEDGEVYQQIRQLTGLPLTVADLSGSTAQERETEIQRRLSDESATPFDLSQDPLLRMQLLVLGPEEHVVLLNMHHIAADGWSMGILVREISTLYEAFQLGYKSPLPPLNVQYADYASWQRNFLEGGVLEEELGYWRKQLDGIPQVHQLPLDKPRPAIQDFKAAAFFQDLDATQLKQLHALAKAEGLTLFMILETAFALFLGRWSNATDVVVGVPVAGRIHHNLEPLIGFFINTLVFRTDLSENVSFRELLRRAKQTSMEAFAHQSIPFEALIDALKPERNLAFNPVCQFKFVMQNHEQTGLQLPGLEIEPLESGEASIHFDLDLTGTERTEGLRLVWRYKTSLFDSATIERMADGFGRMLDGILERPGQTIYRLPLLNEAERERVLFGWQGRDVGETLTRLEQGFAVQAQRTPNALAALGCKTSLTYKQLETKANRLAHYLADLEMGQGHRVGIFMNRSPELLIAMLGVLKSGAAYVPLELKNTRDRLGQMLDDAGIEMVLVHSELLEQLPLGSIDVLVMDEAVVDEAWLEGYPVTPVAVEYPVNDVAYLIYTSGSTGRPKGVMVSHQAAMNYCGFGLRHYFNSLLAGSLVATSHGFDITVPSLFLPLLRGGFVDLSAPEDDLLTLAERLAAPGSANYLLRMTPNHAQGILAAMDAPATAAHTFVIGGDRFPVALAQALQERFPASQIYNHYGPSETTVGCAIFDVTHNLQNLGSVLPIGKPMENRRLYVLNRAMEPVPAGVTGELFIGGEGVADGYVNQPAQTAKSFLPDPFAQGQRIYRSGDLVRWMPDGNLEFVGREDGQVKIRGFRVELAEIETHLLRSPKVGQAVVLARKDASDQMQLRIYVTLKDPGQDKGEQAAEIRQFLGAGLPDYMVPSQITILEQWPLTVSGKIDRKALPEPDQEMHQKFVEPKGETERVLAEIWRETLRQEKISATASFFDIGGHSLLATRVLSEVLKRFGKKITVRSMFEHKTIRSFGTYLDGLGSETYQAIPTAARTEDLELSFAQQRLWFIDQLESGSVQYNIPRAFRVEGPLDDFAFQIALDQIVERHEVLRTNFWTDREGRDRLIIRPATQVPISLVDLSTEEPEEKKRKAAQLIQEEASRKFNLSEDLILRCSLIKLAEQEHIVLLTTHHIASDGWSVGVMAQEFNTFYQAFAEGEIDALPELAIQYVDFAQWQRRNLQGERLKMVLNYWVNQLKGLPQVHRLPLDHPRPKQQVFRAKRHATRLDKASMDALHQIAKEHQVTLFMVMQSAFAVLLGRWSSETDVAMGMPIAGRTQKEIEPLIGFFVNLLVLRNNLAGNLRFSDLLEQSKRTALDAYAYQELPFDMLVQQLHPERSLGYHPLFQVLFSFRSDEQPSLELSDIKVSMVESDAVFTRSDLEMAVSEYEDGLTLHWLFAENLFEMTTIERMASSYTQLLKGIIATTQSPIHSLPLLTERDELLLLQWNQTQVEGFTPTTVPRLFEAKVAANPDLTALRYGSEALTYAELDRRANQLAHWLRSQGVKIESLAGLCMERSPDLVVAMLAIFKAGGVYVPLDPSYPPARLAYMLEDSGIELVVTHEATRDILPQGDQKRLDLDGAEFKTALGEFGSQPPQLPHPGPQNLAYVLYTSGSTGRPKGVAGTHAALANRIGWINQAFPPRLGERHVQKTSINFIDSLTETLGALLGGAELHILPHDKARSAHDLGEFLKDQRIQRVTLVPSLLKALLSLKDPLVFESLELMICSGEVLEPALMVEALEVLNGTKLLNLYGSSEVCGDVSYHLCQKPSQPIARVPIGRPIAHTKTFILDSEGQRVPPGVRGALYLEGVQVARCYWKRAGLTAERFRPNPFSDEPGARMHVTGDLVRQRIDGEIEYLGRNDFQVKLRGFRLELGEIEACLNEQPQVRAAALALWGDSEESRQLVAYLELESGTLSPESSASASQNQLTESLKTALEAQLPEYMVPAVFVILDALPLTPSGKVDRTALPDPSETDLVRETYIAPRTHAEKVLCEIWQELLQLERVGIDDNFFDLGGHSLLATRVVSGIAEKLEKSVGIWTLFEHRTVRAFAAFLEKEAQVAYETIPQIPRDGALGLSFSQQRLWFIDQLEGASPQYNMPIALRLDGVLNLNAMQKALDTIVARHEILRGTFSSEDEEGRLHIHPPQPVAIQVLELKGNASEAEIQKLAKAEARKPFDLRNDPMLRCTLVNLGDQAHVALFTLHHIAADGWSLRVLVKEFVALYQAFLEDAPNPLPPLSIQYADFAHWQRQALSGEKLEKSLDYWSQKLEGIPRLHSLPLDFSRPPQQNFSGTTYFQVLDRGISEQLNQLARDHDATLFMVLESLFALLMSRLSNESDIVIGSPIAGRPHKELEPLIGFFVNTLVLRTRLSADMDFVQLLEQTKKTALEAYDHQDVPFEMLVETLHPDRSLSHTSLFQLMFVLQNNERTSLKLPGLEIGGVPMAPELARFDLDLSVNETDDGLQFTWQYATSLFTKPTIIRMAESFVTLVKGVVANPHQKIDRIPILDDTAKAAIFALSSGVSSGDLRNVTVPEMLERQLALTPHAPAIRTDACEFSYLELHQKANQVANDLIARGVKPGDKVGVFTAPSFDMFVGMLGIMKTGATYVPIEIKNTPIRIAQIIEEAGLQFLLTQTHLRGVLPSAPPERILLDDPEAAWMSCSLEAPQVHIDPKSLIYIIFTSGSTGRPKGVMSTHAGIMDYCAYALRNYYQEHLSGALLVTSYAVDLTTPTLYVPLMHGGCVDILPEGEILETMRHHLFREARGNYLLRMTPMHASGILLLSEGKISQAKHVFVIGGEAFPPSLAKDLQHQFPMSQIYNHYGPTETAVGCSIFDISQNLATLDQAVPIGKPMENTTLYVLDSHRQLQPLGVVGELYIGGAGVSPGYLNKPDITAEKFVDCPFQPGEKLFKTGDSVRWLPSGDLAFLGRLDSMVKLRGFRVDLTEIETYLQKQEIINNAVVLAKGEGSEQRLVAYVTTKTQQDPTLLADMLRRRLKAELPDYMVPAAIVLMDEIPVHPNGKTNFKALPEPDFQSSREYVPPETETEKKLVAIWEDLLKLEKVSVTAGFFELGGHSLLAAKKVNLVKKAFEVELPIRKIFEEQDVRGIARVIDEILVKQRNQQLLKEQNKIVVMEW